MRQRLACFGWMGLFWTCFFVVSRIVFLLWHLGETSALSPRDIATAMFLGLRMDFAMAAYWLIITGLLFMLPYVRPTFIRYAHTAFTFLLLLISTMIVVVDLELYTHWGFRMNSTPLFYISREAVGSVNTVHAVWMILIFLGMMTAGVWIYRRFIEKKIRSFDPLPLKWSPVMLLITGLLFIPIRSSFSVAPLNVGVVYFHKTKAFPNHAGINVVWNFFNSFSAKDQLRYPNDFYTGNAMGVLTALEKSSATPRTLLRTVRPNIILIVLESFTAKIIEPLGGLPDITPNLNALAHEGVLFDHFYASGDRTDKGLIALLSSYPAQPRTSIIRFPHKTQHLPFLSASLRKLGYHTSFVYGGDIGFANMGSYLTTAGFSHITDDSDFASSLDNSKWGVADHYVFERLKTEADTARQPFFKVMLSLSSHEPFEVPMTAVIPGSDERALFLNACLYTDKSLGAFMAEARKAPWWDSTLIVITADHGHRFPDPTELKDKSRFRIPMLWLGGAISKRDTIIRTLGSQTDLAATLLGQIDVTPSDFTFSKNLIDPAVNPFAVYIFQNGFGYIGPDNENVYDFDFNKYILETGGEKEKSPGRAYMQVLFNDYNAR